QRGIRAERQLGDGLGERGNDFVHINGVLFAAQRAVLRIEVVDHVADQTVQTGPLIIRLSVIRHGHPHMRRSGHVESPASGPRPKPPPAVRKSWPSRGGGQPTVVYNHLLSSRSVPPAFPFVSIPPQSILTLSGVFGRWVGTELIEPGQAFAECKRRSAPTLPHAS